MSPSWAEFVCPRIFHVPIVYSFDRSTSSGESVSSARRSKCSIRPRRASSSLSGAVAM